MILFITLTVNTVYPRYTPEFRDTALHPQQSYVFGVSVTSNYQTTAPIKLLRQLLISIITFRPLFQKTSTPTMSTEASDGDTLEGYCSFVPAAVKHLLIVVAMTQEAKPIIDSLNLQQVRDPHPVASSYLDLFVNDAAAAAGHPPPLSEAALAAHPGAAGAGPSDRPRALEEKSESEGRGSSDYGSIRPADTDSTRSSFFAPDQRDLLSPEPATSPPLLVSLVVGRRVPYAPRNVCLFSPCGPVGGAFLAKLGIEGAGVFRGLPRPDLVVSAGTAGAAPGSCSAGDGKPIGRADVLVADRVDFLGGSGVDELPPRSRDYGLSGFPSILVDPKQIQSVIQGALEVQDPEVREQLQTFLPPRVAGVGTSPNFLEDDTELRVRKLQLVEMEAAAQLEVCARESLLPSSLGGGGNPVRFSAIKIVSDLVLGAGGEQEAVSDLVGAGGVEQAGVASESLSEDVQHSQFWGIFEKKNDGTRDIDRLGTALKELVAGLEAARQPCSPLRKPLY